MNRTAKILLGLVLVCFAFGVGWGLWYGQQRKKQMAQAAPLRVLCAENWISPELLERFSHEHGVPVQLFTYARPGEFLRQMANSDGKVDVVCTSSFLLRSLVRSKWIRQADYMQLPNAATLAVDFVHLPYDTGPNYGLPLFWNLYGFFGKAAALDGEFKDVLHAKKVALWGEELNVLNLLAQSGVNLQQRLEQEQSKGFDDDVRGFIRSVAQVIAPKSLGAERPAWLDKWDWVVLPLAQVTAFLDKDAHFLIPEDGAAMEVGVLAVGDKSAQPELAMALLNELIHPDHALEAHRRLKAGLVHRTFDNVDSISPWLRPQALRKFPLNRLRFPDLNVETLPRFEKIYDENLASDRN